MITRNHVWPVRRANAANSPICESGKTIVSSHTAGMLLMTSTAGLSSTDWGCAAIVSNGLAKIARLAI